MVFVMFQSKSMKVSESETVLLVDIYRHGPMDGPLFLTIRDVPRNATRGTY